MIIIKLLKNNIHEKGKHAITDIDRWLWNSWTVGSKFLFRWLTFTLRIKNVRTFLATTFLSVCMGTMFAQWDKAK